MVGEHEVDVIEEMERLDRFFDGTEPGEIPLERLRASGMEIPDDDAELDDGRLHATLRQMLDALLDLGMAIENTDHLSDRECYRWLVGDALREETLFSEGGGCWHVSPIGGGSEEDNEIYLRYYADEKDREQWARDFGVALPPHEKLPYDRDRLLGQER